MYISYHTHIYIYIHIYIHIEAIVVLCWNRTPSLEAIGRTLIWTSSNQTSRCQSSRLIYVLYKKLAANHNRPDSRACTHTHTSIDRCLHA